jgi:hypothetical protein
MLARFLNREAFDMWVDCQHKRRATKEELEEMVQRIIDGPYLSGSGFDADDYLGTNRTRVYLYSSYHAMKNGMYDRWVEFRVRWHAGLDPMNYRLYVIGDGSRNTLKRHPGLRDYIEESVHYAIEKSLPPWWGQIVWPGETPREDAA